MVSDQNIRISEQRIINYGKLKCGEGEQIMEAVTILTFNWEEFNILGYIEDIFLYTRLNLWKGDLMLEKGHIGIDSGSQFLSPGNIFPNVWMGLILETL